MFLHNVLYFYLLVFTIVVSRKASRCTVLLRFTTGFQIIWLASVSQKKSMSCITFNNNKTDLGSGGHTLLLCTFLISFPMFTLTLYALPQTLYRFFSLSLSLFLLSLFFYININCLFYYKTSFWFLSFFLDPPPPPFSFSPRHSHPSLLYTL